MLSHPSSKRVRDVLVPDSEREVKPLKISLKVSLLTPKNTCIHKRFNWRRGSESGGSPSINRQFSGINIRKFTNKCKGFRTTRHVSERTHFLYPY